MALLIQRRRALYQLAAPFVAVTAARSADLLTSPGSANIPNVAVSDQNGKQHRFYHDLVEHKIVLLNMFYADCTGICPRMTSNLLRVQKALSKEMGDRVGRDLFLYSISLKPEDDTPDRLLHYSQMHGIKPDSGWLLLRAERPDLELLRSRLGFRDSDEAAGQDANQHTGMLRFGNDATNRWNACPLLGPVDMIVEAVLSVDPTMRRRGLDT